MKAKKNSSDGNIGKARKSSVSGSASRGTVNLKQATGYELTRRGFLKTAGLAAAGVGVAAIGLGGVEAAQGTTSYTHADKIKTLAAVADTFVPGEKGQPVPIFSTGETLTNLGAEGTFTPGAAFQPLFVDNGVTYLVFPAYMYMETVLQKFGVSAIDIVSLLDELTSIFHTTKTRFYELPYEDDFENGEKLGWGRYHILYMMNKPDLLIPVLSIKGHETPIDTAVKAAKFFRFASYVTYTVYFSELCNIIPSGSASEQHLGDNLVLLNFPYTYSRVEGADPSGEPKYSWRIIPGSIWDQAEFPGPSYKNPSFASEYEGLKVMVSDGKVNFI